MGTRAAAITRAVAIAVLWLCLAFTLYMAYHAYEGSKQTGAGAAQGDFGFWMVLRVVTPIVLVVVAVATGIGLSFRRSANSSSVWFSAELVLGFLTFIGLAWNWLYLFAFWKA